MTTADWMCQLTQKGVNFGVNGDKLRVECTDGAVADHVRPTALARKHEILALLRRDWGAAASALFSRLSLRLDPPSMEDLRMQFLERAAVCELDGGRTKTEAEHVAYAEIAAAAEIVGDYS